MITQTFICPICKETIQNLYEDDIYEKHPYTVQDIIQEGIRSHLRECEKKNG